MFTLFLKVLCIYLASIAVMRLLGKSTIIQMTPYDLVAIIIIGTVVSEPLISTELWSSLITLGVLAGFHVVFSWLTLNQVGNRLFLGEPTLLIKDGVILEDNLEKSRLSVAQLLSILRNKGYPKPSDVEYAMLEPIGEVSVIPKAENTPVTVKHLSINIDDEGLPISVIVDGRIQHRNLRLLELTEDWLRDHLNRHQIKEKDIIYGFVNAKTKDLVISLRTGELINRKNIIN